MHTMRVIRFATLFFFLLSTSSAVLAQQPYEKIDPDAKQALIGQPVERGGALIGGRAVPRGSARGGRRASICR